MTQWNSPAWKALCSGEACPICLQGGPEGIIKELEKTYLTCGMMAPMRGYCCLVLKRHAVELYELSDAESSALMRDMQRAAFAIQQITAAVKMNYEIHGNTIPHLHVHLFPRYADDPFQGGPIDPRKIQSSPYASKEAYEAFITQLQVKLQFASS